MTQWLVFGRTEYAQPLQLEGTIEADSVEDASARALEQKGREWIELTLLPRSSVHQVLGAGAWDGPDE